MLLSNALKKKNRMVKKIRKTEEDIRENNSLPSVSKAEVDVEKLIRERETLINELINLKLKIFIASQPIRDNILRIAELKSEISFLESLSTKNGMVRESDYGKSENVEYIAVLGKKEVDEKTRLAEERIDELQDEIDKHNHTEEIE